MTFPAKRLTTPPCASFYAPPCSITPNMVATSPNPPCSDCSPSPAPWNNGSPDSKQRSNPHHAGTRTPEQADPDGAALASTDGTRQSGEALSEALT